MHTQRVWCLPLTVQKYVLSLTRCNRFLSLINMTLSNLNVFYEYIAHNWFYNKIECHKKWFIISWYLIHIFLASSLGRGLLFKKCLKPKAEASYKAIGRIRLGHILWLWVYTRTNNGTSLIQTKITGPSSFLSPAQFCIQKCANYLNSSSAHICLNNLDFHNILRL